MEPTLAVERGPLGITINSILAELRRWTRCWRRGWPGTTYLIDGGLTVFYEEQ